MKNILPSILAILLIILNSYSQSGSPLVLVESVPEETILGIPETQRTLPVWLDMIQSAKRSIDVEIFYMSTEDGGPLNEVIEAIKFASARGVRIRIIADAKMFRTYPEPLTSLDALPNAEVRTISTFDSLGGVMHAKYFVVDKRDIFVGSQNMDWRAIEHIHELGVRLKDAKIAATVVSLFELDWQLAKQPVSHASEILQSMANDSITAARQELQFTDPGGQQTNLSIVFSPEGVLLPGMSWDEPRIIQLIDSAKQTIRIQLLTYKTVSHKHLYSRLDNAVRSAAARGVKVQMIVSDWNTRKPDIDYLKSLQTVPNIEIKISTLPQWSGGFIPYARVEHCKYMAVDNRTVWIGTNNWGYSYFYLSRNLGFILHSDYYNHLVRKIFEKDWSGPYCLPLDICKTYAPPHVGIE